LANGTAARSRRDAGIPFLNRHGDEKLFRFVIGGHLRTMLQLAIKRAGLASRPARAVSICSAIPTALG
jgi:hypothetical protein